MFCSVPFHGRYSRFRVQWYITMNLSVLFLKVDIFSCHRCHHSQNLLTIYWICPLALWIGNKSPLCSSSTKDFPELLRVYLGTVIAPLSRELPIYINLKKPNWVWYKVFELVLIFLVVRGMPILYSNTWKALSQLPTSTPSQKLIVSHYF